MGDPFGVHGKHFGVLPVQMGKEEIAEFDRGRIDRVPAWHVGRLLERIDRAVDPLHYTNHLLVVRSEFVDEGAVRVHVGQGRQVLAVLVVMVIVGDR